MLSETDLIILRAAVSILGESEKALTYAGIESDDRNELRNLAHTAGAFDVARDALSAAIIAYEVRVAPQREPQSLRVPDDAA